MRLSHNIGNLRADLHVMSQRSEDMTPLADKFRRIIRDYNARQHQGDQSIGSPESSGRLRQSVERLDVWRVLPLVVIWGTALAHAHDYAVTRREQGMTELLPFGDELAAHLLDAWTDFILRGTT